MDEKQQSYDFVPGRTARKQRNVALRSILISSSVLFLPHHSCFPQKLLSNEERSLSERHCQKLTPSEDLPRGLKTPSNFYSDLGTWGDILGRLHSCGSTHWMRTWPGGWGETLRPGVVSTATTKWENSIEQFLQVFCSQEI